MSSEFTGWFGEEYSARLSSQRFDSTRFDSLIADYTIEDQSMMERGFEEDLPRHGGGYVAAEMASEGGVFAGEAPLLPPPTEEGFALREWRRQNVIRLEEKERKEKEMLKVIIEEADEYKAEFYKNWMIRSENSKAVSREKQKLFVQGREQFHAEANKSCWKAISELIPREIPVIEKKGNKEKDKIVVIQGPNPKPGKPTDLSRMRQILVKLKHEPPVHMKPPHETEKTAITQEETAVDLPSLSTNQGVSTIAM